MEKLKTCKYKVKKLFQPLPKKQYEDVDTYLKYLRIRETRKAIPLPTGILSGTLALASLCTALGNYSGWAEFYAYSALVGLALGAGSTLICYEDELYNKLKLLNEDEQEK